MIEPSLQIVDLLTKNIRELDRAIEKLCEEKYPVTQRLRQITGVGAITSLCYVLTIEDPERFKTPRDVAAYLGLVPKRDQSGNLDKQMRISKAGDAYLRRLLVGSAQYILGPFGPDSDLRRHGLELGTRGGAKNKKKAVIAIARKLAVLLLVLWKHQRDYEPLRQTPAPQAA
jgi:transposase